MRSAPSSDSRRTRWISPVTPKACGRARGCATPSPEVTGPMSKTCSAALMRSRCRRARRPARQDDRFSHRQPGRCRRGSAPERRLRRAGRPSRSDGGTRALARGVANIGVRPTVRGGFSTEVHLLDFDEGTEADRDLYGSRLRIHLMAFLRGERKFDGLDALKSQIAADASRARELLAAKKVAQGPFGGWY